MILRNVAVRHGRRALASPVSRSALRQLSTEAPTETSTQPPQEHPVVAPAWTPGKIVRNTKKKQKIVQETIFSLGSDSSHEHRSAAWTTPREVGTSGNAITPAEQYAEFQRIQKNTKSVGSRVTRRYVPTELVHNPPKPEDVTLELLMASQTHMGHNTSLWNPANSRYIHGVRQGIHIISLETTAAHLRRAARVVEDVAYRGGLILFVGTRKGQMEIVTKAADLAGSCHLFTKWTPGAITNRDVILNGHGTKVVDHTDASLEGFDLFTNTTRPLVPDLVVCLNPLENYTLLYECGLKSIPTIGVIDTDADPSWVTYTIPANDDSFRSVAVIAGVLGRAGGVGQARRREAAEQGDVPWTNPRDLAVHMDREIKSALVKRKEVMGRIQAGIEGFSEDEQKLLRTQFQAGDDLQVSEDEMVGMMGAAAEAPAETTASADQSADAVVTPSETLAAVEAHLDALSKTTAEIEAEIAAEGKSSST